MFKSNYKKGGKVNYFSGKKTKSKNGGFRRKKKKKNLGKLKKQLKNREPQEIKAMSEGGGEAEVKHLATQIAKCYDDDKTLKVLFL